MLLLKPFHMKPLLLLLLFTGCLLSVTAQRRFLAASVNPENEEQMQQVFDTDTTRFYSATTVNGKGLFIVYRKSDTLNFKNHFLDDNEDGYISIGIAYYSRHPNGYKLEFANRSGFFCEYCNNMKVHDVVMKHDTAAVYIGWGPRMAPQYDRYLFVNTQPGNRWRLAEVYESGGDDEDGNHFNYYLFQPDAGIYMDKYNAENVVSENLSKTTGSVKLMYQTDKYKSLLDALNKLPKNSWPYLPKVFDTTTASDLLEESPVTAKTVAAINDIGYFFEEAGQLTVAEYFLKKVLAAFPKREVAYFNLGDVYRKQGLNKQAAAQYNTYIRLMTERGLQQKIPQQVTDFTAANPAQ